jgi:hypothetical protein
MNNKDEEKGMIDIIRLRTVIIMAQISLHHRASGYG